MRLQSAAFEGRSSANAGSPDFVAASATATPAVVHIKSMYPASKQQDPFGGMFGAPGGAHPQSSGSGVVISADGYIATNNHVVRRAETVEVILEDKRSYKAKIVGTDPSTDLALLKIEAENLPFLSFGNSDELLVGEWVLAVGNPFNLTSTVTAGIVSAKGRSLNILNEDFAIESFIQTDAAVNPGNSGGALINTQGSLVGINTAIASETGSFAGYSFAVPANIVRKVMEDLKDYGQVQRGIIGVSIRNIDADFAQAEGLKTLAGAYVNGTIEGGAARAAGIKSGDVITKVNETPIRTSSELQGTVGTYRPGETVSLEVLRGGEVIQLDVVLRDREGRTTLTPKTNSDDGNAAKPGPSNATATALGAVFAPIPAEDLQELGLEHGVKVTKLGAGKLKEAGIPLGFVVTRVNKQYVLQPSDVAKHLSSSDGSVLVEGFTVTGEKMFYAFEN